MKRLLAVLESESTALEILRPLLGTNGWEISVVESSAELAGHFGALQEFDAVICDPLCSWLSSVEFVRKVGALEKPPVMAFFSEANPRLLYAFRRLAQSKHIPVVEAMTGLVTRGDMQRMFQAFETTSVVNHPTRHRSTGIEVTRRMLEEALVQRQFVVYFQPRVRMSDETIIGAEALVRWRHPEHGLIMPDSFIPLMEETGQIHELTWVVLDQSLRQLRKWLDAGHDLHVSVNFSAQTLLLGGGEERVGQMLKDAGVPPSHLSIEVTETAMVGDFDKLIESILTLYRMGVESSIDDYGTGYSSLQQVSIIPAHELKLDKSFISNMTENESDYLIVRNTIKMAHSLGMRVLAEGVETESQKMALQRQQCDEGQGYLWGKPVPSEEFDRALASNSRDTVRPIKASV